MKALMEESWGKEKNSQIMTEENSAKSQENSRKITKYSAESL